MRVTVACSDTGVSVLGEGDNPQIEIPLAEVTGIEVGGPGKTSTSAGVFGGGFGVEGAAEGMAIAGLINAATKRTKVDSRLRVSSRRGEIHLRHTIFTPDQLRVTFSPIFVYLQAATHRPTQPSAADDPIAQLERLVKLRETGALREDEFQAARAPLVKRLTETPVNGS